jgi:NAD(P)-dependent dehydrogenase (short-subunit alcohol dehydrogenase family)
VVLLAQDALAGKVAVVTGGGTGIGAGICDALAQAGASVVISPNKNVEGAQRTATSLRAAGAAVVVQACDVRDNDQVQ